VASKLVAAAAWLMYVYLPLLVLAVFFIRFADLQGVFTSLYHLAHLAVDIGFLLLFWRKLRSPAQKAIAFTKWLRTFCITPAKAEIG
jgi:hypothetical protein